MTDSATLWLTIAALGLYHGLNPAMGWPIAVANGLAERRGGAVFSTVLPLGGGHFAAMAIVLAPFAWLASYVAWSEPIRFAAGALVLLFGVFKVVRRRHPRALARIRPTQLGWWSFLMATAHGAGLMLTPFMLGLCTQAAETSSVGSMAGAHVSVMAALSRSSMTIALAVATVHTLAMMLAGLAIAWAVYRYLGLQFLRRAWINVELAWGLSLVAAGAAGMLAAS